MPDCSHWVDPAKVRLLSAVLKSVRKWSPIHYSCTIFTLVHGPLNDFFHNDVPEWTFDQFIIKKFVSPRPAINYFAATHPKNHHSKLNDDCASFGKMDRNALVTLDSLCSLIHSTALALNPTGEILISLLLPDSSSCPTCQNGQKNAVGNLRPDTFRFKTWGVARNFVMPSPMIYVAALALEPLDRRYWVLKILWITWLLLALRFWELTKPGYYQLVIRAHILPSSAICSLRPIRRPFLIFSFLPAFHRRLLWYLLTSHPGIHFSNTVNGQVKIIPLIPWWAQLCWPNNVNALSVVVWCFDPLLSVLGFQGKLSETPKIWEYPMLMQLPPGRSAEASAQMQKEWVLLIQYMVNPFQLPPPCEWNIYVSDLLSCSPMNLITDVMKLGLLFERVTTWLSINRYHKFEYPALSENKERRRLELLSPSLCIHIKSMLPNGKFCTTITKVQSMSFWVASFLFHDLFLESLSESWMMSAHLFPLSSSKDLPIIDHHSHTSRKGKRIISYPQFRHNRVVPCFTGSPTMSTTDVLNPDDLENAGSYLVSTCFQARIIVPSVPGAHIDST